MSRLIGTIISVAAAVLFVLWCFAFGIPMVIEWLDDLRIWSTSTMTPLHRGIR